MSAWKVLLLVFLGTSAVVIGGCAALIASIHINLRLPGDFHFGPTPTKAELAAAATTVPPTHKDCVTLQRIADAGTAVGRVNFGASDGANFTSYRDRLSRVLITYDVDLRAAIAVAHGPLRTHLVNAEHAVLAGLTDIRSAKAPTQYDSFAHAANGYTELVIAQQLLLGHCGRGVEPDADSALPGPPLPKAATTTTAA